MYYVIVVVARVSFEKHAEWWMPWVEYYIDVVFFFDMFRNFTEPFEKEAGGRMIFDRKEIAKNYITGWLIIDLYCFYPLAYYNYTSDWEKGGKDDY
jgi:hypothetical protein